MSKIKGLRWYMIGLVAMGVVTNYLDRNALSVAASTINKELGISTQQYSYIVASFQACYAIMQPFAGYIVDFLGTKIGLAVFGVGWCVVSISHGFTGGWFSLAFLRGLLGITESAVSLSGVKASQEWFPAKERSVAVGWYNVGSSLGGAIAPPVMVFVMVQYNWRVAFMLTGSIGFLWLLAWLAFYKTPNQSKRLSDEERAYITAGQELDKRVDYQKPSWMDVLSCRQWWALAIPRFLAEPAQGAYNFWIPLYLVSARGLNLKELAMMAWVPFVCADLGCIFGGHLGPFYRRVFGVSVIRSGKMVVSTAAILMMIPACIGLVDNIYLVVALIGLVGFAHQSLVVGGILPLNADIFGHKEIGTATGLNGGLGWAGTTIFTLLIGALVDSWGYNPMFIAISCFDVVAALIVWNFLKEAPANLKLKGASGEVAAAEATAAKA